tara:strand:- start:144 stop:587 length:444 start_codon:yes stop_codon:yes gene_type:complete
MTPKERHELIVSRIGQVSAVTATRTIEQKIPRVEIPDNMEEAFGFDPDAMDDKPFLKHEVTQQLQHQLQRIKEETSARMTNSSDTQQQSGISASGLIDTAHKIRAEKVKIKQDDGVTCVVVCGCVENTGTYLFLFFVVFSCLCVLFF